MLENDVKKVIFSSSAAIYGNPIYYPIDEKHPQNPVNPYGQTKLIIEKIMDDYDRLYGLKSIRLRYFNVVGADPKGRIGEWHDPETHLIPNILKSTFCGGKTFDIYGDDYDTKDGTCARDYVNVEDLINAHLKSLEYLNSSEETNFFNIGTNKGYSVKEVFAECEKVTNITINRNKISRREGDPAVLIADYTKAKKVLGWHPVKTLIDSISSAYEWEKMLNNMVG